MSVTVEPSPPVAHRLRGSPPPPWRHTLVAVVRRGLRDQRHAVLSWGGSLGVLGAFMAAIYPTIQHTIEQVAKNYPSGLRQAFGVESMNTVEGYVHAEMFSLIVPLAIGYFAIRGLASATAGAEERGELDTTLALPISRRVLIAGSYLVTAIVGAEVMAVTGVMTFLSGTIAGTHISAGLLADGMLGTWALAVFFGGVAALACGALHSSRIVTGIGLGVLVAMYAFDLAGRLANALEPLRWASAFRYYGAPIRDGLDVLAFAGLVAAGTLLLAVGAELFERRDVL